MSEEKDGLINTKTIEDIQIELVETELNLQIPFLGKIQDIVEYTNKQSVSGPPFSSSALMINMGIIN